VRVRNVNKMLMEMKDLISTAVLVPGKLLIVVKRASDVSRPLGRKYTSKQISHVAQSRIPPPGHTKSGRS
jgi:hypothetical protein